VSWHSVVLQLDRDHVRPGSAIDEMIRDNLQIGMLREE
jgi:hypothetical protein